MEKIIIAMLEAGKTEDEIVDTLSKVKAGIKTFEYTKIKTKLYELQGLLMDSMSEEDEPKSGNYQHLRNLRDEALGHVNDIAVVINEYRDNIKTKQGLESAEKQPCATIEQVAELKRFFQQEQHNVENLLYEDRGTCVLGNGISVLGMQPGARKPRRIRVFYNPWSQSEQPRAIEKMIETAKEKFPEIAQYMHYDCGNMD